MNHKNNKPDFKTENDRAFRISLMINEKHSRLATVYESLVDREYALAEKEIKIIISGLRLTIKSLREDDF